MTDKNPEQGKELDIITDRPDLLKYDSQKIYNQLGLAVKASRASRLALNRLAAMVTGMRERDDVLAAGVLARVERLQQEMTECERLVTRLKATSAELKRDQHLAAFQAADMALTYFRDLVADHNEDDRRELQPIVEQLMRLVFMLDELRKLKVDDAANMEELFTNVRQDIRKQIQTAAHNPMTLPFDEVPNVTMPIESFAEITDPEELLKQIRKEIREKERE